MSRRTIVIIIIILVSLLLGGFIGFYFYIHSKNPTTGDGSTRGGFFGLFNTSEPRQQPVATQPISTTTEEIINVKTPVPRLRHIAVVPVSGADFIFKDILATTTAFTSASSTKKTPAKVIGSTEVIRWLERGTGNIFETSSSSMDMNRLSNTTIIKVYETLFTDSGSSVLIRTLDGNSDVIKTQYGSLQTISPTSTEQTLKLQDLPYNITSLALSPDKTKIFTIAPGAIRGTISRTDGGSKTSIFDSPFHEWLTDWPNTNTIVLNTKPSGTTAGFSYILNPQTKAVTKLVGNKNGLTTLLSPDTNKVLYSESIRGGIALSVLDRKTNNSIPLFLKTFPEKCIWSKKEVDIVFCAVPDNVPFSTYPDVWYQGLVLFADTLWKINTKTGETRQILRPLEYTDNALDMTKLTLDAKEDYIMFTNKNDLSLWGYQITTPQILTGTNSSSTASTTKR